MTGHAARECDSGRDDFRDREVRPVILVGACTYCGAPATVLDHMVPQSKGGCDCRGNLTPACARCNSLKSGRTVEEWIADRKAKCRPWPPLRDSREDRRQELAALVHRHRNDAIRISHLTEELLADHDELAAARHLRPVATAA